MKKCLLALLLFFSINILKAQVPDIYLQSASIDTNINGNAISKGDTLNIWVYYKNNNSATRSIYFDFQYNYNCFSIIDATIGGTAIPQGATSSLTNYYYPGYTYVRNSQNWTRNGNVNYNYATYSYNQGSTKAIQRIYTTITSQSNLNDGSYMKIRLKVNQTPAGTAYDSLYMDFAAVYTNNGTFANSNMPDPKSVWVNLNPSANTLVKGNLYKNQAVSPFVNFIDSATNQLALKVSPDINGNFTLSSEIKPNTTYKVQVGLDSLKDKLQQAITISDAAAALAPASPADTTAFLADIPNIDCNPAFIEVILANFILSHILDMEFCIFHSTHSNHHQTALNL